MIRRLSVLVCLAIVFSVLSPQSVLAYQAPTAAQKKEVEDKIGEGNKTKEELGKQNKKTREASKNGKHDEALESYRKALKLEEKLKKQRQEAIELADKYYNPDASNAKGEPQYDNGISGEGLATKDGKKASVKIGEDAFSSPGWLASSKLHEFNHCDQANNGSWKNDAKGSNMNECEAYDREIENAKKSGLSKAEIDEIKKRRKSYYDGLSAANKAKVNGGNYVALVIQLADAVNTGLAVVEFIGHAVAAGDIFTMLVTRRAKEPFTVELALGTPITPGVPGVQTMMVGADLVVPLNNAVTTVKVPGYCLNPDLLPPPTQAQIADGQPNASWTPQNPWDYPERYIGPANIISAGNELSAQGKFHTDMPRQKYLQTVVQRALWHEADPGTYNQKKLEQDLTEQVEKSGGSQTPEQIEQLSQNLWEDINLTIKKSKN